MAQKSWSRKIVKPILITHSVPSLQTKLNFKTYLDTLPIDMYSCLKRSKKNCTEEVQTWEESCYLKSDLVHGFKVQLIIVWHLWRQLTLNTVCIRMYTCMYHLFKYFSKLLCCKHGLNKSVYGSWKINFWLQIFSFVLTLWLIMIP